MNIEHEFEALWPTKQVPKKLTEPMVIAFCEQGSPGAWGKADEDGKQLMRDNLQQCWDAMLGAV